MTKNEGWHEFIVPIYPLSKNKIEHYRDWCEENLGEHRIMLLLSGPSEVVTPAGHIRAQIKSESDALAFKLKWCSNDW